MAAAAAQSIGRFFNTGAQRLGSLLAAAAPKVVPTTTSTAPTPLVTQTSITRPSLRQQVSVTESDNYPYPQTMTDTVPMNNYNMLAQQDVSNTAISDMNGDYGYQNQNVSMDRDLVKQDSIDYSVQDEEPTPRGLRKQDSIADRGYLQNQSSMDSYMQEDIDAMNDVNSDYNNVHGRESPVSVIHVDRLDPMQGSLDDDELRGRGRGLENSLVQPYVPKLSPPDVRKTSMEYGGLGDGELMPDQMLGLQALLPEPTGSPPPDTRAPQDLRGDCFNLIFILCRLIKFDL